MPTPRQRLRQSFRIANCETMEDQRRGSTNKIRREAARASETDAQDTKDPESVTGPVSGPAVPAQSAVTPRPPPPPPDTRDFWQVLFDVAPLDTPQAYWQVDGTGPAPKRWLRFPIKPGHFGEIPASPHESYLAGLSLSEMYQFDMQVPFGRPIKHIPIERGWLPGTQHLITYHVTTGTNFLGMIEERGLRSGHGTDGRHQGVNSFTALPYWLFQPFDKRVCIELEIVPVAVELLHGVVGRYCLLGTPDRICRLCKPRALHVMRANVPMAFLQQFREEMRRTSLQHPPEYLERPGLHGIINASQEPALPPLGSEGDIGTIPSPPPTPPLALITNPGRPDPIDAARLAILRAVAAAWERGPRAQAEQRIRERKATTSPMDRADLPRSEPANEVIKPGGGVASRPDSQGPIGKRRWGPERPPHG